MWALSRGEVATKPKHDIRARKFMFTMTWNPLGFQVVDKLPAGTKMNNNYFVVNIFEPIEQKVFPNGRKPHAKRLTVRLDNCSIHTSETSEVFMAEHNITQLKHPPYSPDLASSDFYMFPTIKERLTYIQMAKEEDLFYQLRELLNEILVRELSKVFDTWIKRPTAVTRGDGSYIP
jgi:transposase